MTTQDPDDDINDNEYDNHDPGSPVEATKELNVAPLRLLRAPLVIIIISFNIIIINTIVITIGWIIIVIIIGTLICDFSGSTPAPAVDR